MISLYGMRTPMRSGLRAIGLVALAGALAGAMAGCGGGDDDATPSGGGFATRVYRGIIEAGAMPGTFELAFAEGGRAEVQGAARYTTNTGSVYTGTVTGSVTGTAADLTAAYGGALGTVQYVGTANDSSFEGDFTRQVPGGTVETGIFNVPKVGDVTSNIQGQWAGTYQISQAYGGGSGSLSINISAQDTTSFSGTYSETTMGETFTGTFGGVIIGNRFTITTVDGQASIDETIVFTVNGNTISGSAAYAGEVYGTFTLTRR